MHKDAIELSELFSEKFQDYFYWIKGLIYSIFIALNIEVELVEILSQLMLLDTALGVIKVVRLRYKFSVKRLLWGFITKLLILVIPMVVALIGKALNEDFLWAVKFTMKILIINEGLSCLTNILSAKNKKEIQNIDLVTILLYQLRRMLLWIAYKIFGSAMKSSIDEISENHKEDNYDDSGTLR